MHTVVLAMLPCSNYCSAGIYCESLNFTIWNALARINADTFLDPIYISCCECNIQKSQYFCESKNRSFDYNFSRNIILASYIVSYSFVYRVCCSSFTVVRLAVAKQHICCHIGGRCNSTCFIFVMVTNVYRKAREN